MDQINFLAGGDYQRQQAQRIAACYGAQSNDKIQKSEDNELEKGGKGSGRHPLNQFDKKQVKEIVSNSSHKELLDHVKDIQHADPHVKEAVHDEIKKRGGKPTFKKSEEDDHETEGYQGMEDEGLVSDNDADNKEVKKSLTPHEFQSIQKARIASCFSTLENDIQKGGEGSRGGKVIGHTKSGKAIYGDGRPAKQHFDFTPEDHAEARDFHLNEAKKHKHSDENHKFHSYMAGEHGDRAPKTKEEVEAPYNEGEEVYYQGSKHTIHKVNGDKVHLQQGASKYHMNVSTSEIARPYGSIKKK